MQCVSNSNMTHWQDVSMSCECVFSPSSRTSSHRSPMVCSRRGSFSKTAGNWLIHCLTPGAQHKTCLRLANRAGGTFLPLPLLTWPGGRSAPASVPVCLPDNPYRWQEMESKIQTGMKDMNVNSKLLYRSPNKAAAVRWSDYNFLNMWFWSGAPVGPAAAAQRI